MKNIKGETDEDLILAKLNPVQREAILHPEGPLLVLAGAGSGKTRVLTRRIVHLILRRDVPPDRILAVTFTNKAAGEMRSRVEAMLGCDAAGLWIGTFHSICLRLLRRHADRLGYEKGITVFDSDDQASLLREVLKSHRAEADTPRVRDLQSVISMAKNRSWSPDDLEQLWKKPERHRLAALYREYQRKLFDQGGADFDDLLLLAVRLLQDVPEVGDLYARKFLHVLVDEYQDTNHVQFRLVQRLAADHGNVMVVGDDDQSIYGWRGADITNILEFERHFPHAHVLRMTQNYRSTGAILNVAGAVVSHNRGRHQKSIWTENPTGDRPMLLMAEDEEEEARCIIHRIQTAERIEELRYGDVAILYRVHAQSRAFEEACMELSVPYTLVGGTLFYQRKEVKDLLAYLRLAVNPRDEVSLARALMVPPRGIGEVGLGRILAAAKACQGDLVRACLEATVETGLKGRNLQKVRDFGELLRDLALQTGAGPEFLLRAIVDRTAYLEHLKSSGDGDWEERQGNVLELLEGAARFQGANSGLGEDDWTQSVLQAYLDSVALYTNLDQRNLGGERIALMTVHNAKGLEFSHVFITGLEEGLFPHFSALNDRAEMEEERRLFYVAATRARKSLCLSASRERRRVNRLGGGGLSRFVEEIPAELLEGSDATVDFGLGARALLTSPLRRGREGPYPVRRSGSSFVGRFGGAAKADRPSGHDDEGDAVQRKAKKETLKGRQVVHKVFGVGRVEAQDGEGPEARLSIVFPQVGRKKIVARFIELMS
jgi:DNA helicase II / ATP-dependent DNA helicase PcrA